MTLSWGHDTIVWYIIKIQHGSEELWSGHGFGYCKHDYFRWGKISWKCWQDLSRGGKFHDYTPISLIKSHGFYFHAGVIFAIKATSRKTWKLPTHENFHIYSMCALWPWPWIYDIGSRSWHPLGHGQQLCEILFRSSMAVKGYDRNMDFWYVCTVTLTQEIWPWVKVITNWVIDKMCGKYYPNPTWQWRVMVRTWFWVL